MKRHIIKATLNFFKKSEISAFSPFEVPIEIKSSIIYSVMADFQLPLLVLEECDMPHQYINYSGWAYVSALQDFIKGRFSLGSPEKFSELIAQKYGQSSFEGSAFDNLSDTEKEKFLEMEFAACIFSPLTHKEKHFVANIYSQRNISNESWLSAVLAYASAPIRETVDPEPMSIERFDDFLEYITATPPMFFTSCNIPAPTEDIIIPLFMVSEDGAESSLSAMNLAEKKSQLQSANILSATQELIEVFNYLSVYTEKTAYLKRAHIPMVVVCAKKALRENLPAEKFKQIMDDFYKDCPIPYKKASDNGTATKSNVTTRIKSLLSYFDSRK